MDNNLEIYDLVLKNGLLIDPSQSINGQFDLAIRNEKIVAIAQKLPVHQAKQTISLDGYLICPGLIDLHAHVYEWQTNFGLPADEVGINSGVTTVVDQGSSDALLFPDFKSKIIDKSQTDVRSFVIVNQGVLQKPEFNIAQLPSPEMVNKEAMLQIAAENPKIVRGFKVFGESGIISRWGMGFLKLGREVCDRTNLPLYVHTGELFPVLKTNRPKPEQVVENILSYLKAGDLLTHCYSTQPDGLMGNHTKVPKSLLAAIESGVLLDLGHGIKFSFDIARRMMAQGVLPHTVSSDVHGDFASVHDDSTLNYSLCGALSKLMALGLNLEKAIATVTINPARVLKAEAEIGTLKAGSIADITVLKLVEGSWIFYDSMNQGLLAKQRLIPTLVVRAGKVIQPHRRLLRDLETPYIKQPIVAA